MRTLVFVWALLCFVGGAASAAPGETPFENNDRTTFVLSESSSVAPQATGMTLAQLVSEALQNNLQVEIDRAQIDEVKALYQYAAAQAFPKISAQGVFGGPTPEAKTTVVNDISTITDPSLEGDFDFGEFGVTFRLKAEAVQPLYTFGKISKGKAAAKNLVRAAEQRAKISEAELVMNVHRAFWTYQLTSSYERSLSVGRGKLEKVLDKIEDLLENDSPQVTENDQLRLRFALATLDVRYSEATNIRNIAVHAMRLLLGRALDAPIEISEADLDENMPRSVRTLDIILKDAETRPELKALSSLVAAHEEFVDFRRAGFWPDFFLAGGIRYTYTSNATDHTNPFIYDPYNIFELGIGVGIRVDLDIFTKLALLEQAEAQHRVRLAQQAFAKQAVELEVRKIYLDLTSGRERIKALERANRSARGWLTASLLAYDIGTGEADELIDSFLGMAASEAELQKTRFDVILQIADLARASGKLLAAFDEK